jgi:hypothetical protein
MRVIATKEAHVKGKNVIKSHPIRVDRNEVAGLGTLKHQAAVRPANHSARKVIPAKAVDEWPEGNDFLPSSKESFLLYECHETADSEQKRSYPVQAWRASSHLHRARKSGRRRPIEILGSVQIKLRNLVPILCFKSTVMSRASPLACDMTKAKVSKRIYLPSGTDWYDSVVDFHERSSEATGDGNNQYRQPESDDVVQSRANSSGFSWLRRVNGSLANWINILIFAMWMADERVMQIETTFENWDNLCKPG